MKPQAKSRYCGLLPVVCVLACLLFLLSACSLAQPKSNPNSQPANSAPNSEELARRQQAEIQARAQQQVAQSFNPVRSAPVGNDLLQPTLTPTPKPEPTPATLCHGEDPTLKVLPSLVEINAQTLQGHVLGTGFIVDRGRGYILTATHVVADVEPSSITVTFRNGVTHQAHWVAQEPTTDISLLQTAPTSFPTLKVLPYVERALERGEVKGDLGELVALGAIDGTYLTRSGETLSITEDNAGWRNVTFNAPTEPGMSGGPGVNLCGDLVGVLSLGDNGVGGTTTAIGLDQDGLESLMSNAKPFVPPTPTPTLVPTPTPRPTPTSTPSPQPGIGYIPSLNATVTGLKFYESGNSEVPYGQRTYSRRFNRDTTRYIVWELNLEHPRPGRQRVFEYDVIVYRSNGTIETQNTTSSYLEAAWTSSIHESGWGASQAGTWPVDSYIVDLHIDGKRIASGEFEVVSALTPTPAPNYSTHLTWIEQEILASGQPPMIPEWLHPYVSGPLDLATSSAIASGTSQVTPPPPGYIQRPRGRVWPGQELRLIPSERWCQFSPVQRLMVVEYALWLGYDLDQWVNQQYGIRVVWTKCPPANSY